MDEFINDTQSVTLSTIFDYSYLSSVWNIRFISFSIYVSYIHVDLQHLSYVTPVSLSPLINVFHL